MKNKNEQNKKSVKKFSVDLICYSTLWHQVWIVFWMAVVTVVCIFLIPWIIKGLFCLVALIPRVSENTMFPTFGDGSKDFVPNFLAGMIGLILGFVFDFVFIRRLRLINDFKRIRVSLIEDLKSIILLCIDKNLNEDYEIKTIDLSEEDIKNIENKIEKYTTSIEVRAILYNVPRYVFWTMKGNFLRLIFNIKNLLRYISISNEEQKTKETYRLIKSCIELLLKIDEGIPKEVITMCNKDNIKETVLTKNYYVLSDERHYKFYCTTDTFTNEQELKKVNLLAFKEGKNKGVRKILYLISSFDGKCFDDNGNKADFNSILKKYCEPMS